MAMIGPSSAAAVLELATQEELADVVQSRPVLAARLRVVLAQQAGAPAATTPAQQAPAQPAQPTASACAGHRCRKLSSFLLGGRGPFRCRACSQHALLDRPRCLALHLSPLSSLRQAPRRRMTSTPSMCKTSGTALTSRTRVHLARLAAPQAGTARTACATSIAGGMTGPGIGGLGQTMASARTTGAPEASARHARGRHSMRAQPAHWHGSSLVERQAHLHASQRFSSVRCGVHADSLPARQAPL